MRNIFSIIFLSSFLCIDLSAQSVSTSVGGNSDSATARVISTANPTIITGWNQGSAAYLYNLNTYFNNVSVWYSQYPPSSGSHPTIIGPLTEGGPYHAQSSAIARGMDGNDKTVTNWGVKFYVDLTSPTVQLNMVNNSMTVLATDLTGLKRVELWTDTGNGAVRQADLYSALNVETSPKTWSGALPNLQVCVNSALVHVYAVDWLERRVGASTTIATPDTAAPAVVPAATVRTGTGDVTLSATVQDASPIASVLFKVDGAVVASFGPQGPYQTTLTFSDGPHAFVVTASDCRGNTVTSPQSSFTIKRSFSDAIAGPSIYVGSGATNPFIDLARIRIGDFNGDGRTDFLRIEGWGNSALSSVYLSYGNGNYYSVSGPSFSVSSTLPMNDLSRVMTADFNGDGHTDLLRINGWGNAQPMSIFLARSDGSFSGALNGPSTFVGNTSAAANVDYTRVKTGDFNGDGKADIAVVQGWGTTSPSLIYLSRGDGTFLPAVNGPSFSVSNNLDGALVDLKRVRVADFNGDRVDDFLRINGWATTSPMSIYLGYGNGSFQTALSGPSIWVTNNIAGAHVDLNRIKIGDFNADGKADIAAIDGWGNELPARLYLATGGGAFSAAIVGPSFYITNTNDGAQLDLSRIRVGDFNGDRADDFMRINGWAGSSNLSIFLSNGAGAFPTSIAGPSLYAGSTILNAQIDVNRVFLGDFSGGGTKDILLVNGSGSSAPVSTYLSRLP